MRVLPVLCATAFCLAAPTAAPATAAPATAAPGSAAQTVSIGAAPVRAAGQGAAMKTYRYGSNRHQNLDLYTPAKAVGKTGRKLGTVVLMHGGGWTEGDKGDLARQARQLAARGYVAVSINYRLAQVAAWPAQRDDALSALRHLRKNADRFNVDKTRMIAIGASAGAQIGAAAATWGQGEKRLKGFVSLSGPLDPRMVAEDTTLGLRLDVINSLVGCAPLLCPQDYARATPKNNLDAHDPPALLFVSRHEPVDARSSVEFARRANQVGSGATMRYVEGSRHATAYWDDVWPTVRDWIGARIAR